MTTARTDDDDDHDAETGRRDDVASSSSNDDGGSSASFDAVRQEAWAGRIPVALSLARTSLSSASAPPPLHRLTHRTNYLHVDLRREVRRLHRFAPTAVDRRVGPRTRARSDVGVDDSDDAKRTSDGDGSNDVDHDHDDHDGGGRDGDDDDHDDDNSDDLPVCWFQDEVTGIALRWHVFAGALYDLLKHRHGGVDDEDDDAPRSLPWRLRLHFNSYPAHLLPLGPTTLASPRGDDERVVVPTLGIVRRSLTDALKQSLFLQHGSSKVAMSALTRDATARLWSAARQNHYHEYWEVARDLLATPTPARVPVRLLLDGRPFAQRPRPPTDTLGALLRERLSSSTTTTTTTAAATATTKDDDERTTIERLERRYRWEVQGVRPPTETRLVDLWRALCCPDHFLYVTVTTRP